MRKRFERLPDPRQPKRPDNVVYSVSSMAFLCVLMFACGLGARRQVRLRLFTTSLVDLFKVLFDVDGVPHGDTMNKVLCGLAWDDAQELVVGMTETLIDKKVLYSQRLFERYYVVGVDGTGVLTYHHRHCAHCLTRTHNGKTIYYHPVLEAKLITPSGFVFSLMSEFIENPEDDPSKSEQQRKQDCELKAFYRLADRLHARFPRLPILLAMDGLYAVGPVFGRCSRYGWKFMITLSDDQLRSVNEEFEALAAAYPENKCSWRTGKHAQIHQQFRWVNDIAYADSDRNEHLLGVVECLDCQPDEEQLLTTTKFKWVTNMIIEADKVVPLANEGGRLRWKIENEAFNVQKNGGYNLEHAYTQNENGMKIYYLLLQVAHLIMQLMEKGSLLRVAFPKGFGSARNLAWRLLEALRNATLTPEQYDALCAQAIQIRFNTS
ncbi:MAG: transposase family protein [Candidatus Aminicenantes bacterium]|nr:MAG: transposase family protein [Candidatus Aminicenantes bacterium]